MKLFLPLLCFFFVQQIHAQNTIPVTGQIKDSITHTPLAFVSITNLTTHHTVLSDKKGNFSIEAALNQVLSFASVGYNFDTVKVYLKLLQSDPTQFYLTPITRSLKEVSVYSKLKYSPYQLDSIKRRNDFFQTITEKTQPVFGYNNSNTGVAMNLDHFYSREKNKRKVITLFEQMEQEEYINYRFTPQLVSKYASLSIDSLIQFTQEFRPEYQWLRHHQTEEDMLFYINDKLKIFFKRED